MDQYPGSGGSGGYGPQGITPAYEPAQAPPKRVGKKKLWIWIAGGALLVVLALVLVLCLTSGGQGGAMEPAPMLFAEDGDVYLAVGAQTIRLKDAAFTSDYYGEYLNALISVDEDTLYFLADVSASSGEGDLMRIALNSAGAEPERIAEDVYTARISTDGNKVLFISDYENGAGELYICAPGGEPLLIEESVSTWCFGFSPNGGRVYYAIVDNAQDYTLMQYSGGESGEIAEIEDAMLSGVFIDDSGRILYKTYSYDDSEYALYLYANEDTERISRDTDFIDTCMVSGRADEFLYSSDGSLYYYSSGDEQRVTDSYGGLWLFGSYDPREGWGGHFVLREAEEGDEVQTLFEVSLPDDPIKIGKMSGGYTVEEGGGYVAYVMEDSLYLVRKSGGSWGDREKVCEYSYSFSFDDGGNYLYYIALEDDGISGDFCRISLATMQEERLLDDAVQYMLSGGRVYALNEDGEAYRIMGERENEQIEEDILTLHEANDGVYMAGYDGDLYYYNGSEAERISRDAVVISDYGSITGTLD